MKKFDVYIELDNGNKNYLVIKHNHINNAASFLMNNKWIKDESTGEYFNFDKVVNFSVSEVEE